jgi:hypothetical protein
MQGRSPRTRRIPRARLALPLTLGLAALPTAARADEWAVTNARHQGIGGAGVAAAHGAAATRWNPGALGFESDVFEVEVPLGLTVIAEGDLLEHGVRLYNFLERNDYEDVLDKIDAEQPLSESELQQTLVFTTQAVTGFTDRGQGAYSFGDAGLSLRAGRFVLSFRANGEVGADPRLDLSGIPGTDNNLDIGSLIPTSVDRTGMFMNPGSPALASALVAAQPDLSQAQAEEIAFQAEQAGIDTSDAGVQSLLTTIASGAGTGQNQTGVRVRGLYTKEVAISGGLPLLDDRVSLGFNLKYLHGTTVNKFLLADDDESRSIDTADRRRSRQMAIDFGVMVQPADWVRLGLTVRNANRPRFKVRNGGSDYILDAQVRAGAAFQLSDRWLVAADLDLTQNDYETLRSVESQSLAIGTEYRVGFLGRSLDLRLGLRRDLADGRGDVAVLTSGLGFYFGHFNLDLALASSLEREDIDNFAPDIPGRIDFALTLRYSTEL